MSSPMAAWAEHATGLVALALTVSGLVRSSDAALRWKTGLAALLWAAHNGVIGAETAAAVNLLTVFRQLLAMAIPLHHHRQRGAACALFITLGVVSAALTWQGWPTVAIGAASVISTCAMFYLHRSQLRGAMLLVSALWLYNAVVHHSIEQTVSIAVTAAASVIGAWRLRRLDAAAAMIAAANPTPTRSIP